MPRKSRESLIVVPREGGATRGHPAPRGLSAPARVLWCAIVTSKPHDWFDPGSLVLLRQFCEISMIQEGLHARWRAADQADQDAARVMERRVARGAKTLGLLASKLRLTPQSRVRYDAGQLDEKGAPAHRLLGGSVTPFTGPKR